VAADHLARQAQFEAERALRAVDVAPEKLLRDQVDLDSMDWLNFLIAVHQRFKVEIAEPDYATLDTLDRICELVAARNPQAS
jgi:acyl carrier protein